MIAWLVSKHFISPIILGLSTGHAYRARKIVFFPLQLATSRIGNHAGLIQSLMLMEALMIHVMTLI